MTAPTVEQQVTASDEPEYTGGMIALIPTERDAAELAVEGGESPDRLHLTLVYLGEDVTGWDPDVVAAVHEVALKLTNRAAELAGDDSDQPMPENGESEEYRGPGQGGPLTLSVFAHARFNPNGGPDDPCMVYLFEGGDDLSVIEALGSDVRYRVKEAIGEVNFPEQHPRFFPHVTAGYNLEPDALNVTGPVTFDRMRVVLGNDATDYPLGGDAVEEITAAVARAEGGAVSAKRIGREDMSPDSGKADGTVTASAGLSEDQHESLVAAATMLLERLGPADAYQVAPLVFLSPESLAVADEVIEPPIDDELALTAAGEQDSLPSIDLFTPPADMPPGTGHYVDHEPMPDGRRRVYGRLAEWDVPHIGFDGRTVYPPRSPSGYRWFHTKGAWVQGPHGPERIKVGHITFGVGHAPTAGIDHLAAAAHYDDSRYRAAKIRMSEDQYGPTYAGVTVAGLDGPRLEEFSESDVSGDWRRIMGRLDLIANHCVNVGGFPKVGLSLAASGEPLALVASARAWGNPAADLNVDLLAETIAERVLHHQALTAGFLDQQTALLADLDESSQLVDQLLDDLGDDLSADEITFIDSIGDPSEQDIADVESSLVAAAGKRTNWVEKAGGLPKYIKRISKHLIKKGMTESHAIAVAVNAVKRMCSSGDTNLPGIQNVKSRAEACASVADWLRKRGQSKAS